MVKSKPEEKLYDILKQVKARVFDKIGSIKKFPDDFLDEQVKKDLGLSSSKGLKRRNIKIKNSKDKPPTARVGANRIFTNPAPGEIAEAASHGVNSVMAGLTVDFKYKEVLLPEGKAELKIDRKFEIYLKGASIIKCDYFAQAKYVLYSRKKMQLLYKIPKDEKAVKKAVADYEKYLEGIREKLKKAFIRRRADRETAEYLAGEAMKENNLKII